MTITDEQIEATRDRLREYCRRRPGQENNYLLETTCREFEQYISEVERLRADLKCTEELYAGLQEDNRKLQAENARLTSWVNDLQSGMFVNCVYCGHRYGPKGDTPTSMADILKEHITQCSQHPLSIALAENAELKEKLERAGLMPDDYERFGGRKEK